MNTIIDYNHVVDSVKLPWLTIAWIFSNIPKNVLYIDKIIWREYNDFQKIFTIYMDWWGKTLLYQRYIPDVGERFDYRVSIIPKS